MWRALVLAVLGTATYVMGSGGSDWQESLVLAALPLTSLCVCVLLLCGER